MRRCCGLTGAGKPGAEGAEQQASGAGHSAGETPGQPAAGLAQQPQDRRSTEKRAQAAKG